MRTDLLGLTADSLAALTNRGLVKRAGKEPAPELRTDPDGTVHGGFPDGLTATLPPGGLDLARCTCAATGVCRHVIGVILAYQRRPAEAAPRPLPWSPGEVTDEELTAKIGARSMAAARRAERSGFTARVRRATSGDPVPQVELTTTTVRFLVPGDLAFVHTGTVAGGRDEVIALAVWAFRVADALHPGVPEVRVDVGGEVEAGTGSGLERALGLAGTVLREGAAHLGPGLEATVADVQHHLDTAGLRWPLLAVGDLAGQLASYRDRSSHYRPELLASHIAELHARHRAVTRPDATLRGSVLGTGEAAETPLGRTRLESLGCRILGRGDQRIAEVYLAHSDSAMVLVLRHQWDGHDDTAPARRRIATSTLAALATGDLVTESAIRSASRTVRLAGGRISKSTVSPSRGGWGELPPSLVVTDFAALSRELDALPLRPLRPRVEAELVRAVAVTRVETITYTPGDQRLDAVIADQAGNTATVRATHTGAAPGRLDSLAAVLAGEEGEPRFVSGVVGRTAGGVVIEPIGLAAGGRVIVPDLQPAGVSIKLAVAGEERHDPLTTALLETRNLLAEAAHHGLSHLPPTYDDRLTTAAQRLTTIGLHRTAQALTTFATTRTHDSAETAEHAWIDAYLRLDTALDLT